ncbi:cytochrome c oxidase subunit 6A, mitochondrial-like [Anastrepha ludens]|uniref:cytochrome c oxidase subunit 6A, mitochondrial-like n=1 Tax=Anastrepha ludens TaxID=28586 RepID=UPI0023B0032B|nr:cytochrome c oxidase subunit 6A, mitochondrial-like [Anastrepha ludens]
MFTISKFSVPRILQVFAVARQAASKSGGKGGGDKGKDSPSKKDGKGDTKCGSAKKKSQCENKKDGKDAKKDEKKDAKKDAKKECVSSSGGDGKKPSESLGGVGREISCKEKVNKSAKGASTAGAFKKICLFGVIPTIVLLNILIFSTRTHDEREEFKKWPHLYKRDKTFPWRDGVKSLFHNSYANPLPDSGYEDD